jgi:argininosuccinate synthase
MERVVLAYSGDVDTSMAIAWLKESSHAEIVAVTVDVGRGRELEEVRERALECGAIRAHVLDVREEFARDFVLPALKSDASDEGGVPVGTELQRPLIARKLVEIAGIEGATAVAHGGGGRRAGRASLDALIQSVGPNLTVFELERLWGMGPEEKIDYARRQRVAVPGRALRHRTNWNLWGRTVTCDTIDAPESGDAVYVWTKSPGECPEQPAFVDIRFESGAPTAINDVQMPLVDLIGSLGTIAAWHGIGRGRSVRDDGLHITEAPAAVILHAAHRELQKLTTTEDVDRVSRMVSREYAAIVRSGLWFSPLRAALDAFVDNIQPRVSGSIRLRLLKGEALVVGGTSPFALPESSGGRRSAVDHRRLTPVSQQSAEISIPNESPRSCRPSTGE